MNPVSRLTIKNRVGNTSDGASGFRLLKIEERNPTQHGPSSKSILDKKTYKIRLNFGNAFVSMSGKVESFQTFENYCKGSELFSTHENFSKNDLCFH